MNKHVLSISIITLAVAIVLVNIWKASSTEDQVTVSKDSKSSIDVSVSEEFQAVEGEKALDFELVTLEGERIRLSDYEGKKVILNFWATWCPPCKAEMPHMQNFKENNDNQEVEIIAVNLTNVDKGDEAIQNFISEYGLTFPVPLDEKGEIGTEYKALTIPTSYMIDSNGIIRKKIVGAMDEEMMNRLIEEVD